MDLKKSNKSSDNTWTLLHSLTEAGQGPEEFRKACLDWFRYSEQAMNRPEFEAVLASLSKAITDEEASRDTPLEANLKGRTYQTSADLFFLNKGGMIIEISIELSEILDLKKGDFIVPNYFSDNTQQDRVSHGTQSVEIQDRFQHTRNLFVSPLPIGREGYNYAARLVRASFTHLIRDRLKTKYGLTQSEQDILELSFRRYNPEQIAIIRNNSLNTVRTHISRIIKKMNCKSLVEAVAETIEASISLSYESAPTGFSVAPPVQAKRMSISAKDARFEYTRYGLPHHQPYIILHSTEYGFVPSQAFIEAARKREICLYFLRRPGYGKTTSAHSLTDTGKLIANFIDALELSKTVIVALSTSCPSALHIEEHTKQIEQMVLINYGLNSNSKIESISPKWIRGLVAMAIGGPASFSIGLKAMRAIYKSVGISRFYKMLYSKLEDDLSYLEKNGDIFEEAGAYLLNGNEINIRLDLMSAFMHFEDLDKLIEAQKSVLVLNGEAQHKVTPEEAAMEARRLNVGFESIPAGGRNWMFNRPDTLFDLVEQHRSIASTL